MAELTPSGTFSAQAIAKGLKPGLYAITDSQLLPEDRLLVAVEAAFEAGPCWYSTVKKRRRSQNG
ncbi:hypothetical protein AU15_03905 [Marinobacter salarius]|uniref:Uncharacterized protein n=1 Tax=Marinobacter salarius TaxID=1420917 RepID=W5Z3D8_9GAMM|nr:hypothetical protein AU15_03905 [Marinobacter salarius]